MARFLPVHRLACSVSQCIYPIPHANQHKVKTILTLSFAHSISVPAHTLMRELDGECVILNLESECYFGLDEVGTRMWMVLTASKSVQAAYEKLLDEYEVEPQRLQHDFRQLIEKLIGHGLVEISEHSV